MSEFTPLREAVDAIASSAPAPDFDQLMRRATRRNRRRIAMFAGAVAVTVLGVSAITVGGDQAGSHDPVGPPTETPTFPFNPDNPGLREPLIAPESLAEVRELGFHVKGLGTLGAALLPDRRQLIVVVDNATFGLDVYYKGESPDLLVSERPHENVSINGLPGQYVESFDGSGYATSLIWEYAPDSWAVVSRGDPVETPERKAQVLTVAEAIRPGSTPAVVPYRLGSASASILRAETLAEVDLPESRDFWRIAFESGLAIGVSPARPRSLCDRPWIGHFAEPFTYRGYTGCFQRVDDAQAELAAIILEVDGTERRLNTRDVSLTGYELEDLKQLLADITEAPSEDHSAWFDLKTALGG